LTECSFGIAHDRLIQCITDAKTFEPHWENLLSIDLSGKQLDSVVRLKEFLPSLDTLKLCVLTHDKFAMLTLLYRDDNALPWLSGVPNTVHVLSAVWNR
jgi:protein NUD1